MSHGVCISVFVFVPHIQDYSEMFHVVCTTILVYRCNKQASNVLLSIQFSELLRHVFNDFLGHESYDPLPSLGEFPSSSLKRLCLCLSCLF
jgi:hypothetical protein